MSEIKYKDLKILALLFVMRYGLSVDREKLYLVPELETMGTTEGKSKVYLGDIIGIDKSYVKEFERQEVYSNLRAMNRFSGLVSYGMEIFDLPEWRELKEKVAEYKLDSLGYVKNFVKYHLIFTNKNFIYFLPDGTFAFPEKWDSKKSIDWIERTLLLTLLNQNICRTSLRKILATTNLSISEITKSRISDEFLTILATASYLGVSMEVLTDWDIPNFQLYLSKGLIIKPSIKFNTWLVSGLREETESVELRVSEFTMIEKELEISNVVIEDGKITLNGRDIKEMIG